MAFIQTIQAYKIYFLPHKEYSPLMVFSENIASYCKNQSKDVNKLFIRVQNFRMLQQVMLLGTAGFTNLTFKHRASSI